MTRILIAEDEDRIVGFLEKGLQANGYTTVAVSTGTDAIALARDDAFDLMILDLGLPNADGHEVLRQVRGRGERLPVIVLTARDGVDETIATLEGGADDHMAIRSDSRSCSPASGFVCEARAPGRRRPSWPSEASPWIFTRGGSPSTIGSSSSPPASSRCSRRSSATRGG